MSSDEGEKKELIVSRNAMDSQRIKLEKLMKNPDKPVFIPEASVEKLPRAFNPPEIVRNIWGSSAGAGSGDFHVYRGIRRREYARQKYLDAKDKEESLNEEYQKKLENNELASEERTTKKRAKRLKKKEKEKRSKEAKKARLESTKNNDKNVKENNDDEKGNRSDDDEEEEEDAVDEKN